MSVMLNICRWELDTYPKMSPLFGGSRIPVFAAAVGMLDHGVRIEA